MAKKIKIKTSSRRRIDGGHNVVLDLSSNVSILHVSLRSSDVSLSYNGNIGSSSSSVFTNNTGIFGQKWFEEEEKEDKGGEENMEGFVHRSKGFIPMNMPNPKGESFNAEEIKEGRSKVSHLKEKLAGGFSGYYFRLFQLI